MRNDTGASRIDREAHYRALQPLLSGSGNLAFILDQLVRPRGVAEGPAEPSARRHAALDQY